MHGDELPAVYLMFKLAHYIKDHPEIYTELEEKSQYLENGFKENMKSIGKNYSMNRVGSMMTLFFTEDVVDDYASAVKSDTALYGKYFHEMLKHGIYLAPAQFEAAFISTAHTTNDLDRTINANYEALKTL